MFRFDSQWQGIVFYGRLLFLLNADSEAQLQIDDGKSL